MEKLTQFKDTEDRYNLISKANISFGNTNVTAYIVQEKGSGKTIFIDVVEFEKCYDEYHKYNADINKSDISELGMTDIDDTITKRMEILYLDDSYWKQKKNWGSIILPILDNTYMLKHQRKLKITNLLQKIQNGTTKTV